LARVLILDGHSAAALAFTRSLGRAGYWVAVGANRGIFAAATLSRYCQAKLEYPVSTEEADVFTAAVAEFVRRNRIELVVPVTDWTTWPLSRYRERLDGICRLALPTHEALEIASDKYRTIELARSQNVPAPETWLIQSVAHLHALPELSFPVVVKDRFSVRWQADKAVFGSVAYAYSAADLVRQVEQRLGQAGDVLVQSFVAGTGIGFSCFAVGTEICLPFAWQRIREIDPRGSGSSARKSIALDSNLRDLSESLIKGANFQGLAMVEYKRELATGQLELMEINGRPWGSLQLPIVSGINYPLHMVRWILEGVNPPREIAYKKGITCRRMVGELTHLDNLRRGKPPQWPGPYPSFWGSLMRVAAPWSPGMRYDDLSLSDPRPGLSEIANWFRIRLGRKSRGPSNARKKTARGIVHCHTAYSCDGKLNLPEFCRLLRREGFSFVGITEHTQGLSAERYEAFVRECGQQSDQNFVAIPGLEFRCEDGVEIAGIGISRWMEDKRSDEMTVAIRSAGGFSIWVHPFKNGKWQGPFLQCDAVEVMNGKLDGVLAPNLALLRKYKKQQRACQDAHAIFGLDFHNTRQPLAVWVECEVEALTREAILAALRGGHFMNCVVHGTMSSSGEITARDYARLAGLRGAYLVWRSILRTVPNRGRELLVSASRPLVRMLKRRGG